VDEAVVAPSEAGEALGASAASEALVVPNRVSFLVPKP
jgi:hypothetical protein